jgi:hypothetical protein
MPEERVAPHLAVRDDVESGVLLESDGFVHCAILDLLELGGREFSPLTLLTGVEQVLRTEETADDVASNAERQLSYRLPATSFQFPVSSLPRSGRGSFRRAILLLATSRVPSNCVVRSLLLEFAPGSR